MPQQLRFELPARKALGREDFFATEANALALALVDQWPDWPGGKLVITGPAGSGKTHLAHVWAERAGGRIADATALTEDEVEALAQSPVCIEDIDRIAGNDQAETALFHLHNLVLADGHSLLMTSSALPGRLEVGLPDLKSRIQGAQAVALQPPDDALLTAIMAKLFADRQIVPASGTIEYLVQRMPRSFTAARMLVDRLDNAALARRAGVTRDLARSVLQSLEGTDEFGET